MCQRETPPGTQNPKPARRTRTKTRRPKFLSLRLKLAPESRPEKIHHHHCRKNRLNLFPVHAESVDVHDDSSVAHFFHSDGGASLTGLLSAGNVVSDQRYGVSSMSTDRDESRSPASLTCAYGSARDRGEGGGGDAGSSLVRTAMRRRRRGEEERWVSYEDVVEKKEEEVTSCSADIPYHHHGLMSDYHVDRAQPNQRLSLKLDYEEIMNAWSDKGPLYVVDAEAPQTVPDVNDDFLWHDYGANVWVDGWGGGGGAGKEGLWRVPEKDEGGINMMTTTMGNEEEEEGEGANRGGCLKWKKIKKMEQREASVLRYKEKRRNRLFSKRIRYEVRKLNAEKRPRIKGRFVKRS